MYWFHLKSPAILIDPIQSLLQLFGQFYVVVVVVVCLFVLFCFSLILYPCTKGKLEKKEGKTL